MNKKINDFGLFLQVFLVIVMAICFVVSFYIEEVTFLANILLGCVFLTMSHNNERIYKKKYLTIIYALVGVIVLVYTFLGL